MSRLGVCLTALALGAALAGACGDRGRPKPGPFVASEDPPIAHGSGGSGGQEAGLEDIPDPEAPCDGALDLDDPDPRAAARAIELCTDAATEDDWGVIATRWVLADGSGGLVTDTTEYHLGHGLLDDFGDAIVPLAGARLLALSSGTARAPDDPGFEDPAGFDKGYSGGHPEGFPKESPFCDSVMTGEAFDDAALEVELRAPDQAQGFAFDFDFYTYEWPEYVCHQFNDAFVTMLSPVPTGQSDGNVSFDQQGNPVSVNNAFVRACDCETGPPCPAPPMGISPKMYDCELGAEPLDATGFEFDGEVTHAATGWLTTEAPVTGGATLTLRFAVYDAGDPILDSTVVVDHFRWQSESGQSPITEPR